MAFSELSAVAGSFYQRHSYLGIVVGFLIVAASLITSLSAKDSFFLKSAKHFIALTCDLTGSTGQVVLGQYINCRAYG